MTGKPIGPPSTIGTSEPAAAAEVVIDGMTTDTNVVGSPEGSTVVTVDVTGSEVVEEPICELPVGNNVGKSTERDTDIEIKGPPEEVLVEEVSTLLVELSDVVTGLGIGVTTVIVLPDKSVVVIVESEGAGPVMELNVVGVSVGNSVGKSTERLTEIEINGPPEEVLEDELWIASFELLEVVATVPEVIVTKVVGLPEGSTVVAVELPTSLIVEDVTVDELEVGVGVGKRVGRSTDSEIEIDIKGSREEVLVEDVWASVALEVVATSLELLVVLLRTGFVDELVVGDGKRVGRSTDKDTEMEISGSREEVLDEDVWTSDWLEVVATSLEVLVVLLLSTPLEVLVVLLIIGSVTVETPVGDILGS